MTNNEIIWILIVLLCIFIGLYIFNDFNDQKENYGSEYGFVRHTCRINPLGKYIHTCDNCKLNTKYDIMKCDCKDTADLDRTTILNNVSKCSNIENIDGKLECVENKKK